MQPSIMQSDEIQQFKEVVFRIQNETDFNSAALALFRYQFQHVNVYKRFVQLLNVQPEEVQHYTAIPFLPVTFFRDHVIADTDLHHEKIFYSSGTTGQIPSRHYVRDLSLYNRSIMEGFRLTFGQPEDYIFLALLPSYLEREHASLVYMMEQLIRESQHSASGFYLNHTDMIPQLIQKHQGKKIFLLGVTFALMEFARSHPIALQNTVVVETGGMKGRGKELIREELHTILKNAFHIDTIYSEYGMTELLSQAWSAGDGFFSTPPWMKILIRDLHDPFQEAHRGTVNIIDLANVHSCSFLATQDLGMINNGMLQLLGRTDYSEVRGCNLMMV